MIYLIPFTLFAPFILLYPLFTSSMSTLNTSYPVPDLPPNSNLSAVRGHCFSSRDQRSITPTNVADCEEALRVLVREPGFSILRIFSRNHRRGVLVPRGWRANNCIIFTSCENDYDADLYRYADVLYQARRIIDQVS